MAGGEVLPAPSSSLQEHPHASMRQLGAALGGKKGKKRGKLGSKSGASSKASAKAEPPPEQAATTPPQDTAVAVDQATAPTDTDATADAAATITLTDTVAAADQATEPTDTAADPTTSTTPTDAAAADPAAAGTSTDAEAAAANQDNPASSPTPPDTAAGDQGIPSVEISATDSAAGEQGNPSVEIPSAGKAAADQESLTKLLNGPRRTSNPDPRSSWSQAKPMMEKSARSALRKSLLQGGPPKRGSAALAHAPSLGRQSSVRFETSPIPPEKSKAELYVDDDPHGGEVMRDADGTRLSILKILDGDDNDAMLSPSELKAKREKFLLDNRAADATTVPELHKRLVERREVMATLTNWTTGVLKKRGLMEMKGVKTGELVDADQLEETKKTKTGNTGLGAELRAYWKATVCEEVDIRFNAMRSTWEKAAAADMAELKELRETAKRMKMELNDANGQITSLGIKLEVAQKSAVSAQRNATKQEDSTPDPNALSAGQQALLEAVGAQSKDEKKELKSKLDEAAFKAELFEGKLNIALEDLEGCEEENAELKAQLEAAEAHLSELAASAPAQAAELQTRKSVGGESQGRRSVSGNAELQGRRSVSGNTELTTRPSRRMRPSESGAKNSEEADKLRKEMEQLRSENVKLQAALQEKTASLEKASKAASTKGEAAPSSPQRSASVSPKRQASVAPRGKPPAAPKASTSMSASRPSKPAQLSIAENIEEEGEGDNSPANKQSQAKIRALQEQVEELKESLKVAQRRLTARENAASSPKSGSGVQMAQSDAELQLVQSQYEEQNNLVRSLKQQLQDMQESSSSQQQELAFEAEQNKRKRLLQEIRFGADEVINVIKADADAGRAKLKDLVKELMADFGEGEDYEELEQQEQEHKARRMRRMSSVADTLRPADIQALLQRSRRKLQALAMMRAMAAKKPHSTPVHPAAQALSPTLRPASPGIGSRSEREAVQRPEAIAEEEPSPAHDPWNMDDSDTEQAQELVDAAMSNPRFFPASSRLPSARARNSTFGVSTIVGRQGPQGTREFGMRPASAQPVTSYMRGSIEDATRWGGMFERMHATYLDPSGAWRVYTTKEGLAGGVQGQPLQSLIDSVEHTAQHAMASAKAALQPNASESVGAEGEDSSARQGGSEGHTSSSVYGHTLQTGKALEPTRRSGSASVPAAASADIQKTQQQQQQQQGESPHTIPTSPHQLQQDKPQQQQQQEQQPHQILLPPPESTSRSPSPPSIRAKMNVQNGGSGWAYQGATVGGAAQLKHNVYQQQPGQLPGSYPVRMVTATPQKGVLIQQAHPRAHSAHPSSTHGHSRLAPGEGEPQVPPAPQPFVRFNRLGGNLGLSIPYQSWSLEQPGAELTADGMLAAHRRHSSPPRQPSPPTQSWNLQPPVANTSSGPAGGMLHASGRTHRAYSTVEMMSRMELITAIRDMETYVKEVAVRYERMSKEKSPQQQSYIVTEIEASRHNWLVELGFNSQLQEEIERLHSILAKMAADDSAGSNPFGLSDNARAALQQAEQVQVLQEQHLHQAQAAAIGMQHPPPTTAPPASAGSRLKHVTGGHDAHQEAAQASHQDAGIDAGDEEEEDEVLAVGDLGVDELGDQ